MTTRIQCAEIAPAAVQSLLEGIYARYGLDFRDYELTCLLRRVRIMLLQERVAEVRELEELVLRDRDCLERLLPLLSIHTTAVFRDPEFFRTFRKEVVPQLRRQPFLRVWVAGCATGEEVYSLAILLHEEGLYSRCRIYATDINAAALMRARRGIYALSSMKEYTRNYQQAGGTGAFSSYYAADHGYAAFHPFLRQNVVFARHNLVDDRSFHDFHVIVCRNVLIYFNERLQNRVLALFSGSLESTGFLALGTKESLQFTPYEKTFTELGHGSRIYQRDNEG